MPSAEHEAIVEMLAGGMGLEAGSIEEQRAGMEAMTVGLPRVPDTAFTEEDADGVPVTRVLAPGADPSRTVLYLHGGGYTLGSRATHASLASRISAAAGMAVLLVEYRLAPEAPFPAAVDDAATAWRWLLASGQDPAAAAIAGDSAGGGLTLAALQRIRDDGMALPAGAVCLSPWADLEGTGESCAPGAVDDPMIGLEGLRESGRLYAGDAVATPLASPIHADYTGLPPLLIQVGTREILLSDARTVAERARSAGVAVTLEEEEGLIHVFQGFPGVPESEAAVARIGAWLEARLA
jgi:acetyl esterase/lipase